MAELLVCSGLLYCVAHLFKKASHGDNVGAVVNPLQVRWRDEGAPGKGRVEDPPWFREKDSVEILQGRRKGDFENEEGT